MVEAQFWAGVEEALLRARVEEALLRAGAEKTRSVAGGLSTLVVEGLLVGEVSEAGGVAGGLMVGAVLPISSHLALLASRELPAMLWQKQLMPFGALHL